jgi:hypothetical protein
MAHYGQGDQAGLAEGSCQLTDHEAETVERGISWLAEFSLFRFVL